METEVLKSLTNIRSKTLALVLLLKRNNKVFKRDIDIIANKKRRLRRIIPTIPTLLGSAGAILGSGTDDDDDPAFLIGAPPVSTDTPPFYPRFPDIIRRTPTSKTPKLPGSSTKTPKLPPKTPKLPPTSSLKITPTTTKLPGSSINKLPGSSTKTPKLPSSTRTIKNITPTNQRIKNFISDLSDRKSVRTIKEGIKATRFLNPATLSNPQALVGALIANDIMNNSVADGTLDGHKDSINMVRKENDTNPWVYKSGKGYEFMTEVIEKNLDKEIDELVLTRSQLDPNGDNYKILTDKIADLALQKHNLSPELVERNFIKSSFSNPNIFYPIESENLKIDLPNFSSFSDGLDTHTDNIRTFIIITDTP